MRKDEKEWSSEPLAANKEYKACARILMTLVKFFLRQWNFRICLFTRTVSPNSGTFSGLSRSRSMTTSLNATVMPPPVNGCRMFIASPRSIMPGTCCVLGGSQEFGILRTFPSSRALSKDDCTHFGRDGRTTFRRWPLTPPFARLALGVPSGTSTSALVSLVPIWYNSTGAPSPRTTCPCIDRGRSASISSRP